MSYFSSLLNNLPLIQDISCNTYIYKYRSTLLYQLFVLVFFAGYVSCSVKHQAGVGFCCYFRAAESPLKAGFLRTGTDRKVSFVLQPLVPTESSQDKGNFSVRSRSEENYPEWKPALIE